MAGNAQDEHFSSVRVEFYSCWASFLGGDTKANIIVTDVT